MQRGAHDPVLPGFDRQRDGARLQHRTQGATQGVLQGLERLTQGVVLVGRIVLGQAAIIGEGHQLATRLGESEVHLLRMHMAPPRQVLEQRKQPIEGLQQVEVSDVGNARLPR
ncbi:hypothetical protein D3C84_864410 [compost metagenome]